MNLADTAIHEQLEVIDNNLKLAQRTAVVEATRAYIRIARQTLWDVMKVLEK